MGKATALLADDHPAFRQGLRQILEEQGDLTVVGEAADGHAAIDMAGQLSPDIVLMDVTMPELDGIEATRQIVSASPRTRVVALSVHSGKRFVREMFLAGASGYILKESAPEELLEGVRTVLAGEVFLSRSISKTVLEDYRQMLSVADPEAEPLESPILQTKLRRPPVTAEIIPRKRLVERLEEGQAKALTLISAPAGFGKSILASQWIETNSSPAAWFSLDESDNDLREFLTYFMAAIERLFPDLSLGTQSLLKASDLPPLTVLVRYLQNDLEQVAEPFILVLDDYHRISEQAVHDLLEDLLRHPSPMLHLVLLTRHDPPLPLAGLRAYGQMTELSMKDLRFTLAETTAFLERMLHDTVDEATSAALDQKLEGWATALRLVALSLGSKEDLERVLLGLEKNPQIIQEYLIREVLSHIPPTHADYLLSTSILDRFCAPLCDAVHAPSGEAARGPDRMTGRTFIDWLQETHLFVIPLGGEHQWFRYHHLFQQLLQEQFKEAAGQEEIAVLHQRAGKWFAEQKLIEEAIGHYLAGAEPETAGRLVARHGHALIDLETVWVLDRWLDRLPPDTVDAEPMLLLFHAWLGRVRYQIPVLRDRLNQAEECLRKHPPAKAEADFLWGYLNGIRSFEHYAGLDADGAISCAQHAIDLLPEKHGYMRSFSFVIKSAALQMKGQYREAVSVMNSALTDAYLQQSHWQGFMLHSLGKICMMEADLPQQAKTARKLLSATEDFELLIFHCWGMFNLACSQYQRNQLEAARHTLTSFMQHRHQLYPDTVSDGAAIFTLTCSALGRSDEAHDAAGALVEYARETGNSRVQAVSDALQAELYLREGRLEKALLWAEGFSPRQLQAHFFFYLPELTLAKVLVAADSPDSLRRAQDLLLNLETFTRDTHNYFFLIPVLALQALLLDRQQDEQSAFDKLSESVSLAESGEGLRFFLDPGLPMIDLLKRLQGQQATNTHAERVLAAFESTVPGDVSGATEGADPRAGSDGASLGSEALLTQRELEILTHLQQGLKNREIAAQLFVSHETIKKHLYNIYQKLEVSSRVAALAKARSLGLLD